MKFKVKQNVLPKTIKMLQKYLDDDSYDSYESYDSSDESSSYESSYNEAGSDENSEISDTETDESFDSVSTAERNFGKFIKEFAKTRVYSIKENPLMISYNFDSEKVSGKWKRHVDKSIDLYYRFLNTDKESLKKGVMFLEISKF
jgi:hypothetical protein